MDTLRIAFAGTFAASLEGRVRAHLTLPCDVRVSDEAEARYVGRGVKLGIA